MKHRTRMARLLNFRESKIRLEINGPPVYFSEQIVIFYAVDGGLPKRIAVPIKSIRACEFPHELWERLIEKNTDEPSAAPKRCTQVPLVKMSR